MMKQRTIICTTVAFLFVMTGAVLGNDGSSFSFDWYGYFKLDGAYDQNQTSHGNFVMWVQPGAADQDDGQYNMTANETRFGFKMARSSKSGPEVSAKLEFDLYAAVSGAGVAENKAMLQMRHAFFQVTSGNTRFVAGQTWDIISPLNPSTLNYPVLWGCGNTGYRRPQISLFHTFEVGEGSNLELAGGLFRTIGSDLTPTLTLAAGEMSDGSDDGTDAAIPSAQARFDFSHKLESGGTVRFGVSGLVGRLKAETNMGSYQEYDSWAAVAHFMLAPSKSFGVSGEAFTGVNMGSYFGGVLQNSTIDGVDTKGGWGSLWFMPSPKVKLSAGYGMDDPDDADLSSGRSMNSSVFGNVRYSFVENVAVGLELSQWKTEYIGGSESDNLRAQSSFILNF